MKEMVKKIQGLGKYVELRPGKKEKIKKELEEYIELQEKGIDLMIDAPASEVSGVTGREKKK
jgi:hypothetical protein